MENIRRIFELLIFSRVHTIVVCNNKKSHFGGSGEAPGGSGEAPGGPGEAPGRLPGGSGEALRGSGRLGESSDSSGEAQGGSGEALGGRLGGVLGGQEAVCRASWGHLGGL